MILSYILTIVFLLLGITLCYFLSVILGMLIPVHRQFIPTTEGIDLCISTNGMHTDFILPLRNNIFDWTKIINIDRYKINLTPNTKIGIGWGDKAIYLDIETWGDLTLKMGLATLFLPTPTILHVTAYDQLPTDKLKVRHTKISSIQYVQLCQFIVTYFKKDAQEKVLLIENAGYTPKDNFYHAIGKYHAFKTCNTWVNQGLKKIGIRTASWSPLDKGIFYQFSMIRK